MKKRKKIFRSLAMISQFGINMLVPIFICSFAGMFLDRRLETSFFMIILFFVGAIAGFRNIYIQSRHIYEEKGDKDETKKIR